MCHYVLDAEGNPVRCRDLMTWARWFQNADRSVAQTAAGGVRVSTVFLGIDHSFIRGQRPILYETMVFGGEQSGEQERYATRAEAIDGHAKMVRTLGIST